MIRNMNEGDIPEVYDIHRRFYEKEFPFPDYYRLIEKFVVIEDDRIILCGGLAPSLEVIFVTDKDIDAMKRYSAMTKTLEACKFSARNSGVEQLHAWVQDKKFEELVRKYGFSDCKGKSLFLDINR